GCCWAGSAASRARSRSPAASAADTSVAAQGLEGGEIRCRHVECGPYGVAMEPSRDGLCAREPRGRAALRPLTPLYAFSWSAFSTRAGRSGTLRTRAPVAAKIALESAGAIVVVPGSPR